MFSANAWKRYAVLYVLAGSLFLWAALWTTYYLTRAGAEAKSFQSFMTNYGGTVSVLFTILLGAFVALIPTRLEKEISNISERLHSPLGSFDEIFHHALQLLVQLKDDPKSDFRMVAASPVFGIEMNPALRENWRSALVSRILSGFRTEIVCLDPRLNDDQRNSPLFRFCSALASSYLKNPDKAQDLFQIAREDVEFFQQFTQGKHPAFSLRLGDEPPFQIILGNDGGGQRSGIFYFASTETLNRQLPVSGFVTQDNRMTMLMDHLFDFSSGASTESVVDTRTSIQRERDAELIGFWASHQGLYEVPARSIAPGLLLVVHPNIFPPDISLGGDTLLTGVEEAATQVWAGISSEHRLGVDIGTGSGIVGLVLGKFCARVLATDLGDRELENARENFRRFNSVAPNQCMFETFRGSLLDPLPPVPANVVPLIVFNQPFYPSPHRLFGTGGKDAGLTIIRPFLQSAMPLVERHGGVVMPYSEIAGEHNPLTVAVELGYKTQLVCQSQHSRFGALYIYLFTRYGVTNSDG